MKYHPKNKTLQATMTDLKSDSDKCTCKKPNEKEKSKISI